MTAQSQSEPPERDGSRVLRAELEGIVVGIDEVHADDGGDGEGLVG
jgi:riboflavin biosynthesis pyrimidine reductase